MAKSGEFSGRFLLRLPPGLHALLHRSAAGTGLSLNEYCARKLASPCPALEEAGAVAAVATASRVAGERLMGVVAFGSWARGEAGPGSDVDLLVVLDDEMRVSRDLYRRWDEDPPSWSGSPIEPHFVHLPPATRLAAGVWAEAAVDGLVLFDRSLHISRRLAGIRKDIAEGRIERRRVHGQPYWVEAA